MKLKVVALKDHEWQMKPRKANDVYEIDSDDPRFNAAVVMGLIKLIDPAAAQPDNQGRYKRRDMRPKD